MYISVRDMFRPVWLAVAYPPPASDEITLISHEQTRDITADKDAVRIDHCSMRGEEIP